MSGNKTTPIMQDQVHDEIYLRLEFIKGFIQVVYGAWEAKADNECLAEGLGRIAFEADRRVDEIQNMLTGKQLVGISKDQIAMAYEH